MQNHRLSISRDSLRRLRSTSTRRSLRNTRGPFIAAMLKTFQVRHERLVRRYEKLVARTDQLTAKRSLVARQIRALERAIATLRELR